MILNFQRTLGPGVIVNLTERACLLLAINKATLEALFYALAHSASRGSKLEMKIDFGELRTHLVS